MRAALIAPKNPPEERAWQGSFFSFPVEEYRPWQIYDVVLFWNLSSFMKDGFKAWRSWVGKSGRRTR